MPFPLKAQDYRVSVAIRDEKGQDRFLDSPLPAVAEQDGVYEAAWFWSVEDRHTARSYGVPASAPRVAGPGGSSFGLMRFPAQSSGKLDAAASSGDDTLEAGHTGDPSMHATRSLDYEIILTGKVDFVLPSGDLRTLSAGDIIIVAGAAHAWRNHYDEDCVYAAVTIGMTE